MKIDWLSRLLLLIIAASLFGLAVHAYITPPAVFAQSGQPYSVYVEPGTTMLRAPDGSRQVMGKVVIDLRNGNIWGFPTLSDAPYPVSGAQASPPVSHPFLLGKFSVADIDKQ